MQKHDLWFVFRSFSESWTLQGRKLSPFLCPYLWDATLLGFLNLWRRLVTLGYSVFLLTLERTRFLSSVLRRCTCLRFGMCVRLRLRTPRLCELTFRALRCSVVSTPRRTVVRILQCHALGDVREGRGGGGRENGDGKNTFWGFSPGCCAVRACRAASPRRGYHPGPGCFPVAAFFLSSAL